MTRDERGVEPPLPPAPPTVPMQQRVPADQELREDALEHIHAALRDPSAARRAQAVEALQRGVGREAADALLPMLNDPEPIVRFAAAMAVGGLQLRDAYPDPLLRLVHPREDAQVRVGAIYALHRLHDTRFTQQLGELAQHSDENTRGSAVLALGLLDEPSAVKLLDQRRADRSPAVRMQAFEALWRHGDESARDSLISGMFSQYPDEELFCTLALAGGKQRALIPHLQPKLTSEYSYVALAAARALGQLGNDDGYGVALKGAESRDPRDRALAAFAFADIGRTDAQPTLKKLLRDRDPEVRLAAAGAILKLTAPAVMADVDPQ